jgi:hypothetical protein
MNHHNDPHEDPPLYLLLLVVLAYLAFLAGGFTAVCWGFWRLWTML